MYSCENDNHKEMKKSTECPQVRLVEANKEKKLWPSVVKKNERKVKKEQKN